MADPVSAASGIVGLVAFGFSASKSLYQTIESFKDHPRRVRELKQELEALHNVLQSLGACVSTGENDFSALEIPLSQCGKACSEFQNVIIKCTANSGGHRGSFLDWAKLRYMGSDIKGFKDIIAGYKSTITIALGSATLRYSKVTASFLDEYKDMIRETTIDLQERLIEVDQTLQCLKSENAKFSSERNAELQRVQEERDSTQQCLDICTKASAYIEKLQIPSFTDMSTPMDSTATNVSTGRAASPHSITATALKDCQRKLQETASKLEKSFLAANDPQSAQESSAAERTRIQQEIESIKQCLAICSDASQEADQHRANTFEDVTIGEDGQQVLVSTVGDLIRAARVTAGDRSAQWLGQMSDGSLQQISQDRAQMVNGRLGESERKSDAPFENRYGKGRNLSPGSGRSGARC